MSAPILALDVGSSALKAVLFETDGRVAASTEAGYGGADGGRDPDAWWRAACAAVAALGRPAVAAVTLSGTMENLIPVDAAGRPVCPAIPYSDPCGEPFLAAAAGRLEALGAAARIGNPPEPLMTAFKIGWLRRHAPEALAAAAFLLPGAKDALALRLTGIAATDAATATTTGLMAIADRRWDPEIAAALDVPLDRLPPIRPAAAVLGGITATAAAETGLAAGTPVVNGCGDGAATALGSDCHAAGDVSLHLGTTGWLARVVDDAGLAEPRPVYRLAHPAERTLVEITPILSAGAAVAWARRLFGYDGERAEADLAAIDRAPPDLLFLPYLAGERFPFLDTAVRGAFHGLDAGHGPADLYYAVLEGVAFAVGTNLAAIDPAGTARLCLAGGGAKSAVWPQMIADLLGRPVTIPHGAEIATARGAFLLARRALGLVAEDSGSAGRTVAPRARRRARAQRLAAGFAAATGFARALKIAADGIETAPTGP